VVVLLAAVMCTIVVLITSTSISSATTIRGGCCLATTTDGIEVTNCDVITIRRDSVGVLIIISKRISAVVVVYKFACETKAAGASITASIVLVNFIIYFAVS
jgi:hypothetical protein